MPIPKVLDWSDDDGSLGTEYIIMEAAEGVNLFHMWPQMNTLQHMQFVKRAGLFLAELSNLQFPAYGSLYFDDAPIKPESKIHLSNGFCIGPHCGTKY